MSSADRSTTMSEMSKEHVLDNPRWFSGYRKIQHFVVKFNKHNIPVAKCGTFVDGALTNNPNPKCKKCLKKLEREN